MSADPITIDGEFYADNIDPMLAAIRQSLVDAGAPGSVLASFGPNQVAIVPPEDTEQGINAKISQAMGKTHGLCLLMIVGDGKNPDKTAPGPRVNLDLEMQLYVSTRMRGKQATPVLEMVGTIAKFFHHAQVRISGFPWHEEINFTGFTSLPDDEFTAYAINFEREFQL